jgi:hypothetical protein
MWTGLVAAAAAAAYRKDREGWIPRLPARASEPDPLRSPSTLFVVPIEGAWAWITRDTPSPVRLRALAAEPGRKVAAQVFAADREEVAFRVAELDVVPLFAGASEAVPAWYVTELPARLRVEASFRDGWFARVMERGAVRRLETPAWSEQMGEPGAIRLLPPPDRLDGAKGIEVGPTGLEASEFLGLKTLVVRAPFHHDPTAWLRTGSGTVAAEEAIERERELFARLERRSGARGLRYVSRASLAGTAEYGVLYAAPFGLRAESSPPLADWVRERPLAFIRAVAAAMLAAHEAGFVLGLCHLSMFAFSAGFGGRDAEPRPHAVLCCAPYATPAGHYFPADTGSRGFASFPSLGYQALLPWLTGAEAALPDIDALAFALFALDLLPRRASSTPLRSWSDLVAFSGTAAESYQRPELAARLAAPLHDRSQAGAVLDFMRALAHPTRA